MNDPRLQAVSREVVVPNALGLHARAAARFVQAAARFAAAAIHVTRGDRTVDGKSIMGVLLLAAARGTLLTIAAEGIDAEAGRRRALRPGHQQGVRRGSMTRRLSGSAIVERRRDRTSRRPRPPRPGPARRHRA